MRGHPVTFLSRQWKSLLLPAIGAAALACAFGAVPARALDGLDKPDHMTTLHYASTGFSWSTAPQLVGIAKKFFEAENLHLEIAVAGQSASVCQLLLAKAIDIGQCSMNDVIQIVEASGAPLVLVSNEGITALNYAIMAKPGDKTWADLKGKTIIVGGPKDNTVYYTRVMARANGVKDQDYQFTYAGASGARFAALKSGAVDASILTDPFDAEAALEGFTRLDDLLPKYLKAETYAGTGGVTTRDWAKTHPAEILAYIRAFRKSASWLYDPANKDELFSILQPNLNVTREAFDRAYQKNVVENKSWFITGHTLDSAIQGIVDSLVELGSLPSPAPKAAKFYDNT
ncbi:MAG TPA: ABC transporter substrate-binding protein [Beijerinckiaceae bacterium]|nr:ABC transporter substrate-binding protein [Beijerinckiaceae bacterium]